MTTRLSPEQMAWATRDPEMLEAVVVRRRLEQPVHIVIPDLDPIERIRDRLNSRRFRAFRFLAGAPWALMLAGFAVAYFFARCVGAL